MQQNDPSKKSGHDLGGATAEPAKVNPMQSPAMRILMGVVGVIVMISGIMQMMSGFKEMNSGGMPSEKDRAAVVEKSLAAMTEFQDPSSAFTMSYPSNWKRTPKVEAPTILHLAVYEGTVNVIATAEDEPKDLTAVEYAKVTDEAISKAIPKDSLKRISEEDISLNGTPARKWTQVVSSVSGGEKVNVKQVMILTTKNGKGYCVTASALENWYSQFEPVFDKMASSIKIKD
ncbi:MAG: hypothetical protein K2X77_23670 [Candidatus Obscuribacterales bacterium]|nr:hypothetical protein [Candidatus Obscuribacterales bacterium]